MNNMSNENVKSKLSEAYNHISNLDNGGDISYREEETLLALYRLYDVIKELIKE